MLRLRARFRALLVLACSEQEWVTLQTPEERTVTTSRLAVRVAAIVTGAVLTSALMAGCAASRGSAVFGASGPTTFPAPASLHPSAVTQAQPAFADDSGGTLEPAPAATTFPRTADQVQHQILTQDGAAAPWAANSPTLVVRSGIYHPLAASQPGTSLTPSQAGTLSYVFSGNTAPCPPDSPGGAGTPAATQPGPAMCTGIVVADASTGQTVDVEVGPT